MLKRIMGMGLVCMMLMGSVVSFADVTADNGSQTTAIEISAAPTDIRVQIPLKLTATFAADYTVVKPESGIEKIVNLSPAGPIYISPDTTVVAQNGWALNNYEENYANMWLDTKKIGFSLNNEKVDPATGKLALDPANFPDILPNGGEMLLNYDVKIAGRKTSLDAANLLNIDFIIKVRVAE